jgi:putative ABC transport system permease protein
MDSSMLLFALAAAIVTSVVFGSISALYSRDDLASSLKEGGTITTIGRRRQRVRSALIVCQVAFSFVLLAGAGLMMRSLLKLQSVDPGFVPQRVLATRIMLNWSKYRGNAELRNVTERMLRKVEEQPGIMSAAVSSGFPLQNTGNPNLNSMQIQGRIPPEGEPPLVSSFRVVTPEYFRTLGIPVLRGRVFAQSDDAKSPEVAVINQTFARRYWPDSDPIGQRISFDGVMGGGTWLQIVGVVGDVREFGLHRSPIEEVYAAFAQNPQPGVVLVKTAGDPMTVARQVRRAILDVDPQTALPTVETLEQVRTESLTQPRVMTDLLAIFAALALIVAATGIGGILALTVSQRMREIGIRIAIGAKPAQVFGTVIRQGMALVAAGLVLGIIGALAFTKLLAALLFETAPHDPGTFVAVGVLFAAAALAACYIPARRATKIDPLIALRQE